MCKKKEGEDKLTTLLKNGTVIDYGSKCQELLDIFITDDKVTKIEKNIQLNADKIIDCTGLFIIPGMIDMHCHLREPGFEQKETIETGTKSAIKGGFTTICPMPNTKPTTDSAFILEQVISKAKNLKTCNVLPYCAVTVRRKRGRVNQF